MNLTIHVPEGIKTVTQEEISAMVKAALDKCPSEITCAYRIWYEDFDGYGRPTPDAVEAIEKGILAAGGWTPMGRTRFEKFGLVNGFKNQNFANAIKAVGDDIMPLHMFHLGKHYQGPDGKIFWFAVIEVFDIRCFEWKDGKYIGEMVEIDPKSDYAKQMVEVAV